MGLNVSSYNHISGIDTAAIKDVTKQIFERSSSQNSALANADLTKFNRVSLGTSLYNVNASQSAQIAMANAGINVNLSEKAMQSLRYLNLQASKSVFAALEGQVTLPQVQSQPEQKTNVVKLPSFGKLTDLADVSADKRGSNPFRQGTSSDANDENFNTLG